MNATRLLGATGVVCGSVLLTRTHAVARVVSTGPAVPAAWIVRVLGARQCVQGAALVRWPDRGLRLVGTGVDVVHLLSMLGLAAADTRHRRAALSSAAVAGAFAALAAAIEVAERELR